jgi:hypothetical protein
VGFLLIWLRRDERLLGAEKAGAYVALGTIESGLDVQSQYPVSSWEAIPKNIYSRGYDMVELMSRQTRSTIIAAEIQAIRSFIIGHIRKVDSEHCTVCPLQRSVRTAYYYR